MLRYLFIIGYVVFSLVGAFVAIVQHHGNLGLTLVGIGVLSIVVHIGIDHRDRQLERRAKQAWIDQVRGIADDISLDGYGISTLEELATYHDAAGRAAVLAALKAMPESQRCLLNAALSVEPDATWD